VSEPRKEEKSRYEGFGIGKLCKMRKVRKYSERKPFPVAGLVKKSVAFGRCDEQRDRKGHGEKEGGILWQFKHAQK